MEWVRRKGKQRPEKGVSAQEPLWRTLPTGGGLRTRNSMCVLGGGASNGRGGAQRSGDSAIQGEAGTAGARRCHGPKPQEGQERAQPQLMKPRRQGRLHGPGPGCTQKGRAAGGSHSKVVPGRSG